MTYTVAFAPEVLDQLLDLQHVADTLTADQYAASIIRYCQELDVSPTAAHPVTICARPPHRPPPTS